VKPGTRILRVVQPANGGPRPRTVLDGLAAKYGADGKLVDALIRKGDLVKYSDKRHARWGAPRAQRGHMDMSLIVIGAALVGGLLGLILITAGVWMCWHSLRALVGAL
jgi:hypothetical protein